MGLRERWRRRRRHRLRRWLTNRVVSFLTRPLAHYELVVANDFGALKRHIRKGDVLLSQGNQRISAIIAYLTQSPWTHTSLYIGDELVQRGGELAERARELYGAEAEHLLIEALPEGVTFRPLVDYREFNVRVCRPHRLRPEHRKQILDRAIAAIGWRYDLRNIADLALYYLPAQLVPSRFRPRTPRIGSHAASTVICTRLMGELFGSVGFPVRPEVTLPEGLLPQNRRGWLARMRRRRERYPGLFRRPHPSFLAPRDFDVSPYFEIIKFNAIADGDFDYQRIQWVEDDDLSVAVDVEGTDER